MESQNRKDFFTEIFNIVNAIPPGKVTTYGIIAKACGMSSSARMVGWALNKTKGTDIPAHRVVNRNGELTGKLNFSTPSMMRDLLVSEGVEFEGEKVNLNKHLWDPKEDL